MDAISHDELSNVEAVGDHRRFYEELRYVYPVISRRSGGLSIGVNLNPDCRCTFDCAYCEVNRKPALAQPPIPVDLARLEQELEYLLRQAISGELAKDPRFLHASDLTRTVKDIAFSGNGEPTMVRAFGEAVRIVLDVRHRLNLMDTIPVLITNATMFTQESVRRHIAELAHAGGKIWAKLDAGTPGYYEIMNRSKVPFERILEGIGLLSAEVPIYIQTMLLRVDGETMSENELEAYCNRLLSFRQQGCKIERVQVYSAARPMFGVALHEHRMEALSKEEVKEIGQKIAAKTQLAVECYA